MIKKIVLLVGILALFSISLADTPISKTNSNFPNKPIKIIVYTGPGGLIDVTARKFSDVASKYTDVNFVVENKPGAGGIVALKKILQLPSDGYSIYACTKSNIAKFVSTGGESYIDSMEWLAMLMADPECVIVNNQSETANWDDIINNKKEQIWVGPATGGLDHVTALKVWEAFDIDAKWIPYKSGGKAVAALLGNQGVAYVGNPREVLANPDLTIAAVSSAKRIPQFPEVPTFRDLGIETLDNEYMWRGFAIKKGVDEEILQWYKELFTAVTNDPEWRDFWEKGGIDVLYHGPEKFREIVKEDEEIFKHYLTKLEIIKSSDSNKFTNFVSGKYFNLFILLLIIIIIASGFIISRSKIAHLLERIIIIEFFLALSIIFYLLSYMFPDSGAVGPAVVPRLWIYFLIPLNILLIIKTIRSKNLIKVPETQLDLVYKIIITLILYLISIYFLGYFISSFIFVLVSLKILGYKAKLKALIIAISWILFSWLIFYKLLYVPLPTGIIFDLI